MKIEPRLPQLPSLGELLEHPRVKGLVDRVNRSTIAKRAGGFLEEIRASLVERAGRVEIPSVTHLAERLARRLLGEPTTAGPVINATGVVLGDAALAAPLAEPALHAMLQLAGEYHRVDAAWVRAVETSICELTGGEAAHLVASFEGAVTLAVAATAGNRECAVCGDIDAAGPIDWRWVAARAGAVLHPFTISPAPSPSEGRAGEGEEAGTSVEAGTRGFTPPPAPPPQGEGSGRVTRAAAVVRSPESDFVDLVALAEAKTADSVLIDVAPIAGTLNPQPFGYQSVDTIGERLAAGADLVVIDGSGLLGGPACGIVIGRRAAVESATHHPLAALLAIDPLAVAALDAALKVHRNEGGSEPMFQLPVWQLLTAPLANLEQRARRLAALMADIEGIAAEPREVDAPWRVWGARQWSARSWSIELRPADGDAAALAARLNRGPYPVVANQAGDAVQLNLRSVFPRWDQQLVAAVEG